MRLLFLTQVLPYPLDAGPKVRAYYTLRHLVERGHQVTLASFVRPSDSPAALAHLEGLCEAVVTVPLQRTRRREALALGRSLLTGAPLLIARDHAAPMHRALQRLARQSRFDAIHADQLWMAPYALAAHDAARRAGHAPRLVLDQHNAVFLVPRRMAAAARHPLLRWAYNREAAQMARYEARLCRRFDHVVTVTHEDRLTLRQLYRGGRLPNFAGTIPICVDTQAVTPRPVAAAPDIVFVGGMHWPPNADGAEWFVRQVLPRVRAAVPAAKFWAVGKVPPAVAQALGGDAVHLPGYVPDLQPWWDRARLFVVPLRAGGGMRVKILDAWMRGLPVVSTRIGAEGLACADGEDILLADTPEAFAAAVTRVLADAGLAECLAQAGRRTVQREYDWRRVYPAWDRIYPVPA
jgi:glycosyltransferase involved in cell wall biosynthesis